MFKFEIGQQVWFLKKDKVQTGYVRVRQITESSQRLEDESEQFKRATELRALTIYALTRFNDIDPNWQLEESELFASKQALLESL